jgi:DNA-binding NarL/FixJ family response regulator
MEKRSPDQSEPVDSTATAPDTAPSGESAVRTRTQSTDRRVVVVDDHSLLRAGTRRILEDAPGFEVVGEAGDSETALQLIEECNPDVALVDIRLPTTNGIDLARRIVTEHPSTIVLILSAYDDEHYVRAAMAAGVSGYLLKTTPSDELVDSIREACEGGEPFGPKPRWRGEKTAESDSTQSTLGLTPREEEVVRLAARGLSNKSIAHELGISRRTVEGHLNHVFEKLGTSTRTELVHYALAHGLFVMHPTDPSALG